MMIQVPFRTICYTTYSVKVDLIHMYSSIFWLHIKQEPQNIQQHQHVKFTSDPSKIWRQYLKVLVIIFSWIGVFLLMRLNQRVHCCYFCKNISMAFGLLAGI